MIDVTENSDTSPDYRPHDRLSVVAYRLGRRLAGVTGTKAVCEVAVKAIARALGARQASLAVPDRADGQLSILATHGYPLALVAHIRIRPGMGVLGLVYASGVPLRVDDVKQFPASPRRRWRYATDSFVACPISAAGEVLAIASVTDPIDGRAFTHEDMSVLRVLTMPVALALARERQRADAQAFAQAAAIDPVSGLFNRRYFGERIQEELQRARRHGLSIALLMIDLDDFKFVNDRFGHLTGDAVIRNTADVLRRSVRLFDVCTRYGGEEFAIMMPGSGAADAMRIAERVREHIGRLEFPQAPSLRQTASIGIGIASPETTGADLVAHADRALYLAKREGKNCIRMAEGTDTSLPADDHG